MATPKNDRDVLILAGPRTVNLPTAAIDLSPTTNAFHVDTGGGFDPASISFVAKLTDLEGTITFTASGATLTSVTANSAVVTYANMPGATATVTASITVNGTTFSKTVPITKVLDGAAGSAGAAGLNNATVTIYQRTNSTVAPTLPSATTTYTFSNGALSGLNNGWSTSPPSSTLSGAYLHVSTATASASTATDTIAAGEWATPKIQAQNGASINNIVPDPTYRDLGFWNRNITGNSVIDYSAGSTTWKMASSLKIQETANTLVDTSTGYFPMTPGATYRVEIQVFLSTGFTGSFSPFWYVPGAQYHPMGCPATGSTWAGDGLQISFNTSSTKNAITTYTAVFTVPANGTSFQGQIRFKTQMSAGYIEVGSVSLVRMANTELIPPSVTLTTPIIVTGFSVASLSDLSGSGGAAGVVSSRSYGARTASASGGTSPYTYSWSVSQSAGTYPITSSGNTTATITLGGKGKDESNDATVTVTVNDSSGFSATKSFNLSEVHGTPP